MRWLIKNRLQINILLAGVILLFLYLKYTGAFSSYLCASVIALAGVVFNHILVSWTAKQQKEKQQE